MTRKIELFLQGGLGNQIIQLAYAESLRERTALNLQINPILLNPLWSCIRSINHRKRSMSWASPIPDITSVSRQSLSLLRLYCSKAKNQMITDSISDDQLLNLIHTRKDQKWFGLIGYFQRYQAFSKSADKFWLHFKTQVLKRYSLKPLPFGQVVAHIRLGDYLWPENQRLFARYPISEQLTHARRWSQQLGGPETINLTTDDPTTLQKILPEEHAEHFSIYRGTCIEDDFLFIARHRHIVGTNSTFSLCSGRLSSELWDQRQVLRLPPQWYTDLLLDRKIKEELSQCEFISHVDL